MSSGLSPSAGRSSAPQGVAVARSWWLSPPGLLLATGLLSSAFAWWLIAAPVALFANVDEHANHFPLVYAHMLGGTIMLVLGAANLYIGSTCRLVDRVLTLAELGDGAAIVWLSWVVPLFLCEVGLEWAAGWREAFAGGA